MKSSVSIIGLALLLTSCGTIAQSSATSGTSSGETVVPDFSYNIVGTNQQKTYNNTAVVTGLVSGDPFFGQDAHYTHLAPAYINHGDGTVSDLNTGLMWSQTTDIDGDGVMTSADKLTYEEGMASAETLTLGGYNDWRIPTIKELYSLIEFSGTDTNPEATDTSNLTPFIDRNYFTFWYGLTAAGERIIDSQYMSRDVYVDTDNYDTLVFGVNFADGRIKGYGLHTLSGAEKTFSMIYVRGSTTYGINDYVDNQDGTISDHATGLMWMKNDADGALNWEQALAYAENKTFAGYSDWRLPTAKELQSIVDYSRSPDTSDSPAIDPLFNLTDITNEKGQKDWGFYWTSTTHAGVTDGAEAVYIAFGRAMGYMNGQWLDVHGAGAQRSDPKAGDPADYPYGFGPQGDARRIFNQVLLVRLAS